MNDTFPTSAEAWSIQRYGRAEDLRLGQLPVAKLDRDEMLLKVEAASLNPLDLKMIAGKMVQMMPISFPYVPGNDVCGRVMAMGPGVKNYKLGDRVVGFTPKGGGMSRYAICADGPNTAHVPDSVSAEALATLPEVGMTAYTIMRAAEMRSGDNVLIVGSTGGIGLLLCQLASRTGAHVIATAKADEEDLVRLNGAQETIDYTIGETVELLKARHKMGVQVVIDLINENDALVASSAAVAPDGKLVSTLVGPEPSKFPGRLEVRYIRLSPQAGDLDQLVGAVSDGSLRINITRTFPFSEVPDAYVALRDAHMGGKVVITV